MPAKGRGEHGLIHLVTLPEAVVVRGMLRCEHVDSRAVGTWDVSDAIDGVERGQMLALPGCPDCATVVFAAGPAWTAGGMS